MKRKGVIDIKESMMATQLPPLDLGAIDKAGLVDAGGISLDPSLPLPQRAAYLAAAVKDLSFFRVGEIGVKVEFAENGPSLEEALATFLKRQHGGL